MAYQEGDKLSKRSPAVTFGKNMRRPQQNGAGGAISAITVEESSQVNTNGGADPKDQNRIKIAGPLEHLDMTQI